MLHENRATGKVRFDGNTAQLPTEMTSKNHYRLTEGGWAVLNRSHGWIVATFVVSTVGLAVTVAPFVASWITLMKK